MMNRLIFLFFFAILIGYPAQRPAHVAGSQNSPARYACAGNALTNSDFEQGPNGWLVQPNPIGDQNLIAKHPVVYDGVYSAKLGGEVGIGDNSRDTIQQLVTIPNHAVLTFRWLMETNEPYPMASQDGMLVLIMAPSEYPYDIVDGFPVFGPQDTWQQETIDLSKYAGQLKNLRFEVNNDSNYYSTFYVDAVCLFEARNEIRYLPFVAR